MKSFGGFTCAICGSDRSEPAAWFLVQQNLWDDRMLVLEWNERLACQNGLFTLCSVEHVRELVSRWVLNGGMAVSGAGRPSNTPLPLVDLSEAVRLGEIAVDRDQIFEALGENPHSLNPIFNALTEALQGSRW